MKQTNKVKVKLSYKDILGDLRGQPGNGQRIPYPVTTIMGKAGVSWEQIESLHPSAITSSMRYQSFAIGFDKREMRRLGRTWMPGGWLLNKGPGQDTSLDGLEFLVDTTLIK
uniref:Uncharacterized protein n=1 Tax=Kuenenia stuttgartiensis TaxID=174633 RepID=Q1Q5C1_KUEST|nr:unknown protein [Candidatus Kuenenia stuttgartiensis]